MSSRARTLSPGQVIKGFTFLGYLPSQKKKGRGVFLCKCGLKLSVNIETIQKRKIKHCLDCHRKWKRETRVFDQYKRSAKRRGIKFAITLEQFNKITSLNCYYCGLPPSNNMEGIIYSGIDRKNPKRGYEPENCVPCCRFCNSAKWDMTVNEFNAWLRRIFKHQSERGLHDHPHQKVRPDLPGRRRRNEPSASQDVRVGRRLPG